MNSTDSSFKMSTTRQDSCWSNRLHQLVFGGFAIAGSGLLAMTLTLTAPQAWAQETTDPGIETQGPNTAPDTSPATPDSAIPEEAAPETETEVETDTTVETTAVEAEGEVTQYVLERIQSMTGIPTARLQVVDVDRVLFPNPCIGLAVLGGQCTRAVVQADRIVVTDGNVTWTYYATQTGDVIAIHDFQVDTDTVAQTEVQAETDTTETTVETETEVQTESTIETETEVQTAPAPEVEAPEAPEAPVPALW